MKAKVNIINTRYIRMSEAVTVQRLMMMTLIVAEESLARTDRQTDTPARTHARTPARTNARTHAHTHTHTHTHATHTHARARAHTVLDLPKQCKVVHGFENKNFFRFLNSIQSQQNI